MKAIKIETPTGEKVFTGLGEEMHMSEIEIAEYCALRLAQHYQRIANLLNDMQYGKEKNIGKLFSYHFPTPLDLRIVTNDTEAEYHIDHLTIIQ